MSTLLSRAMRRTSGDDFCRRGSSVLISGPSTSSSSGVVASASTSFKPASKLAFRSASSPASAAPGGAVSPAGSGCPTAASGNASGGGESAATAASPASPMVATTLLTGTVSPSLTLISVRTPDAGDGISASTLSVEISNSGSSRSIESPTFLIHRTMVPSAIDSPIWGITTSVILFPVMSEEPEITELTDLTADVFYTEQRRHGETESHLVFFLRYSVAPLLRARLTFVVSVRSVVSSRAYQYSTSFFAAATTFSTLGRNAASSGGEYGTGASTDATRITGASR